MSAVDPDAVTTARDLRGGALSHALPLRPGAEVLILGEAAALARSVARRGADSVRVAPSIDGVLPLEDESVDQALVLWARTHGVPTRVLAEVARVLRPGGGLYFGVPHRWRSVTSTHAWTVGRGRRALRAAGFRDVEAYGVRYGPRYGGLYPRFLVPLEHTDAVRWFLTSMCVPQSAREAAAMAVLARVPSSRVALALFPDLGFVARRAGGAEAC